MAVARANNRLDQLLDSAAELFATKGYPATTMRDIAAASGMLPGSIYYHHPNKEALLVAVYEEGVRRLSERVAQAIAQQTDPWDRLEAMLATHIAMITEPSAYARVIIRNLPDDIPTAKAQLIALRREYEAILRRVVDDLPLAPDVDRSLLRLFLIGAGNHVPVWRREGGATAPRIANQLVRLARGAAAEGEA
ncbi:MAG: TetR/AcrR family transcriptional regulator [Pseudomonadota bacterium]